MSFSSTTRLASEAPGGVIYGDVIKEVDRQGHVVWEWRSWEHLRPEDYPLHDAFERYHWPMTNAVSPGRDGKIILSLRSVSAVIAISRSSNKVLWRLGHDLVAQQHCPSELENGNVLVFDNGIFRPHARMLVGLIGHVGLGPGEFVFGQLQLRRIVGAGPHGAGLLQGEVDYVLAGRYSGMAMAQTLGMSNDLIAREVPVDQHQGSHRSERFYLWRFPTTRPAMSRGCADSSPKR